jgi:hypothetical protein
MLGVAFGQLYAFGANLGILFEGKFLSHFYPLGPFRNFIVESAVSAADILEVDLSALHQHAERLPDLRPLVLEFRANLGRQVAA